MTDTFVERESDQSVVSMPHIVPSSDELSRLSTAELADMWQSASSEADAVHSSAQCNGRIAAQLYGRLRTQAAIDAKAAAILDEERRLACRRGEL